MEPQPMSATNSIWLHILLAPAQNWATVVVEVLVRGQEEIGEWHEWRD